MDCEHAKELFIAYHDGDLSNRERLDLEKHLGECEACRNEWEAYLKTMKGISGLHRLKPSEDFVSRVKQTIGRRSRGRFFGESNQNGMRFAIISFVLILLVLLAYLFISAGSELELLPMKSNGEAGRADNNSN
jgi:predicted anti-sigma-YlaC factor YlaD